MFVIESGRFNYYKSSKDKEILDRAIPLIKEVFGYTDEEIEGFKEKLFFPPLAMDVTIEQAKLAVQPFWDADINVFVCEYDDNTLELLDFGSHIKRLGLVDKPPKSHYYDEPVIRRDQLVDPYNPPSWNSAWTTGFTFKPEPQPTTPTITCPYCQSTNTKKIGIISRSTSFGLFGFGSGKVGKQWHCNSCKSDF